VQTGWHWAPEEVLPLPDLEGQSDTDYVKCGPDFWQMPW
jgi:hypothetical protein